MLKKRYLIEQFEATWKTMMVHFSAFIKTHELEELHQLRVGIKKIFALVSLFQFANKDVDFSNHLQVVKLISSKTGEIRNIQLALQVIERYSLGDLLRCKDEQKKMARLINVFCSKYGNYDNELKKERLQISGDICEIEETSVKEWYADQLKELGKLFESKKDQKYMHEARKLLKKMLYVNTILKEYLKDKIELNESSFHKLEKVIGKWHDVMIAIDILSQISSISKETNKKLLKKKQKLLLSCQEKIKKL